MASQQELAVLGRFYPALHRGAPAAQRDLTIGVGPVTLHPYLDRPQIVTRASRARLILGEFVVGSATNITGLLLGFELYRFWG